MTEEGNDEDSGLRNVRETMKIEKANIHERVIGMCLQELN